MNFENEWSMQKKIKNKLSKNEIGSDFRRTMQAIFAVGNIR